MTKPDGLQEQIDDLQSRLAYQEDTLQQLNDIVALQDAKIEQLTQQLQYNQSKLHDFNEWLNASGIEKPPHY